MNKTQIIPGLREQLARAESLEEINALLETGRHFRDVSAHTRRRWGNTVRARIKALKITKTEVLMTGYGGNYGASLIN